GEPGELTMFVYGRQDAAKVETEGDKEAIEKLQGAKQLGI
ncbi:TIGR03085 family protein, partial [Streptomyces sp. T-3]|nr:TIGR03085 family protein [Streptomyces sp. T-3]